MTMVMVLGNRDQMIMAADRRLSGSGKVLNNSYNKATVINTWNARFSVGFTGIATINTHSTQKIIVDFIYEALREKKGDFTLIPSCLSDKLEHYFKTNPDINRLPKEERRLTVLMGGYLTQANPPALATAFVSNYQDFTKFIDHREGNDKFTVFYEQEKQNPRPDNPTFIQRVGAWQYMNELDIESFREALKSRIPKQNIKNMAVGIIRRISDQAGVAVGKDVLVSIIPLNLNEDPEAELFYENGQSEIEGCDAILYNEEQDKTLAIKDLKIKINDLQQGELPFKPKIGRNDRCHCKSGLKYKKCCGRP